MCVFLMFKSVLLAVFIASLAFIGFRLKTREPETHYRDFSKTRMPKHVAVIGAAGGLGQGVLSECIAANVSFTAIVRSGPERITKVPPGSRVAVVSSFHDESALREALEGVDALLIVSGVTAGTSDDKALLSKNLHNVRAAMNGAKIKRVLVINTLILAEPGEPAAWIVRLFKQFPGVVGVGMTDMQGVADALSKGALDGLDWTLVRAGVNAHGSDVRPHATMDWSEVSFMSVSYRAMARWMLEESVANNYIQKAPLVSRARMI